MAYLKTIKDKSGKRFYYSLIQGVKHVGSKYISLDTDSKSVAKVHHADVIEHEPEIKKGEQIIFSWKSGS